MPDNTSSPPTSPSTAGSKSAPSAAGPAIVPVWNCGPLTPLDGEKPIPTGTTGDAVLSGIQLDCDGTHGVLFFRAKGKLYRRVVQAAPPGPTG